MANVKISELPAASSVTGTDLVEVVQGGVSKRAAAALLGSVDPTFIRGLRIVWVGANAIDVEPGGAFVESTGRVLNVPAKISRTGLVFTAATWYHVYLYDDAGTPAIELSTTAPAGPFYAQTRSKTGDSTRRYLGSVLSDSAATPGLWRFASTVLGVELEVTWITESVASPARVLDNGTATTPTAFSVAAAIPGPALTTRVAIALVLGIAAGGEMSASVGETLVGTVGNTPGGDVYSRLANGRSATSYPYLPPAWVKLRGSSLMYQMTSHAGTGHALWIDLRGYAVAR